MTFRIVSSFFSFGSCCRSLDYVCPLGSNSQNYNSQKSSQESSQKPVISEINSSQKKDRPEKLISGITKISPDHAERLLDKLLEGSNDQLEDLQVLLSIIKEPEGPINRFLGDRKSRKEAPFVE